MFRVKKIQGELVDFDEISERVLLDAHFTFRHPSVYSAMNDGLYGDGAENDVGNEITVPATLYTYKAHVVYVHKGVRVTTAISIKNAMSMPRSGTRITLLIDRTTSAIIEAIPP